MAGAIQVPTNPRQSSSTQTPAASTDQELRSTSGSPEDKKAVRGSIASLASDAYVQERLTSGGLRGDLEDMLRKIASLPDKQRTLAKEVFRGEKDNPQKEQEKIKLNLSENNRKLSFDIPLQHRKDLEGDRIRGIHVVNGEGKIIGSAKSLDENGRGTINIHVDKQGKSLITPDCTLVIEQSNPVAELVYLYSKRSAAKGIGGALGLLPETPNMIKRLCANNRYLSIEQGLDNSNPS